MNFLAGFLIILAVYSGAAGFLIPAAAGAAPEFEARNGQTIQAGDIFMRSTASGCTSTATCRC